MQKEFTLNKNGWYVKLMMWTWGMSQKEAMFTNMCPFFWLTILNILIIPITLVSKPIAWLFRFIDDQTTKNFNKFCIKLQLELLSSEEKCIEFAKLDLSKHSKHSRFYYDWLGDKDSELKLKLYKLRMEYSKPLSHKIKEEKPSKVMKTTKSILLGLMPIIKIIGTILMVCFFLSLLGLIGLIIYVIIEAIINNQVNWRPILAILGIILSAFGIAGLILILANQTSFFKKVAIPFIWLWKGIVIIFQFLYNTYKNNCPGLNFK